MKRESKQESTIHQPVLLQECLTEVFQPAFEKFVETGKDISSFSAKNPMQKNLFLDLTLGGGGHTSAILEMLNNQDSSWVLWSVDQDREAIAKANDRFEIPIREGRLRLFHSSFSDKEFWTEVEALGGAWGILADLGYSSDQLEDKERGLSFQTNGPLDMRLNREKGKPLSSLLEEVEESELADILFQYGEERYSRRIARAFFQRKSEGKFPKTTAELAEIIRLAYPPKERFGRIHSATRSFQAFRIWVNHELDALDELLNQGISHLRLGGRFGVISFHSLEDRRVKNAFRKSEQIKRENINYRRVNKKVIEASEKEILQNPRSRSAKLRVLEKTK